MTQLIPEILLTYESLFSFGVFADQQGAEVSSMTPDAQVLYDMACQNDCWNKPQFHVAGTLDDCLGLPAYQWYYHITSPITRYRDRDTIWKALLVLGSILPECPNSPAQPKPKAPRPAGPRIVRS